MKGFLGLNGNLDAAWLSVRRYWPLVALIFFGGGTYTDWKSHESHRSAQSDSLMVVVTHQAAVLDDMHIEIKAVRAFQRDSAMTNTDMDFWLAQSQAAHRKFDNRIRLLEHRPVQEGLGRWEYYPGYGSVPEKWRLWFDPRSSSDWLGSRAAGR